MPEAVKTAAAVNMAKLKFRDWPEVTAGLLQSLRGSIEVKPPLVHQIPSAPGFDVTADGSGTVRYSTEPATAIDPE